MPLPIRPVVETQDGTLHKTYSDPFAFVPISDLQRQVMEEAAAPYNQPLQKEARSYKTVSKSSKKQLFDIWDNREPEIIQAQTSLNMDPSFRIPKGMTSSDVMRLVAEGLISRQDGSRISFTKLGKQALNKEVMDQPNSFMSNKTREKAVKISEVNVTNSPNPNSANMTEVMDEYNTTIQEDMKNAQQKLIQDLQAQMNQGNATQNMQQIQKIQQMIQRSPAAVPAMASNTSPKRKIEAAIFEKLASCDIIEDSNKIQKLNNILGKLDSGYLTQDEVDLILE